MRICVLIAMVATATTARATRADSQQVDVIRGRITAIPTDAARAAAAGGSVSGDTPLQGVSVLATSSFGGVSRPATTDKNGNFQIIFANGEGDYWIELKRIGYAPQRRQVKRIGNEEVLIFNARMSTNMASMDTVVTTARPDQARMIPNRNAIDPDVGGGARTLTSLNLPADLAGSLAAMLGGLPGMQLVPGLDGAPDMYYALGLGPDQNSMVLDGLGTGVSMLPPDVIARASLTTHNFDPAIGGFSGAQISIQSQPGQNFSRRLVSHGNALPALQWADAAAAAQAQKFTSLRLGGNALGPIKLNEAFYNVSYNVSRRFSDARTLFNTSPLGLAASGVSSDSVAQLADILRGLNVPLSGWGAPSVQAQDAFQVQANIDYAPILSPTSSAYSLALVGNYSQSSPIGQGGQSLLATPTHAGNATRWTGNAVFSHLGYFSIFGVGVLSKTRLGLAASSNEVTPYLDLPEGIVRVRSELDDGTTPVRSVLFGGANSARSDNGTSALQLRNEASWFSANNQHTLKVTTSIARDSYFSAEGAGTLGRFTFNSLADLEAGSATSFSRTLSHRNQSAAQLTAALSLGDYWRPTEKIQLQYGVRLDANHFLRAPELNEAIRTTFGFRTDNVPEHIYISPRLGLQWAYGNAPTIAFAPGAARTPAAVIRAGFGVFQNMSGPQFIGGALSATGLYNSTQAMACVGEAVPAVEWTEFLNDPALVPTQCADGPAGTVFSTNSPSVYLFDPRFRQQRSLRGVVDWAGPILDNRFALGVQAVITRGLNQLGQVDVNFDPTEQFALANEGNRPVYSDPGAIIPATGVIAPGEARVSSDFQRVWAQRSRLRVNSHLLAVNIRPVTANRFLRWSLGYTLLDVNQTYYGFTSTVGNPLEIGRSRSLQPGRHAVSLGWSNFPIADLLYVSANVGVSSGARYTPLIAGDINGDGLSNDRAFVADPATAIDPNIATGLRSLLSSGAPSARECLSQQLGTLAERGSCQAPWTVSSALSLRFNPSKIGLPKRATVSLFFQNPLALADIIAHGSDDVRGWGRATLPDQTLFFVRGFDPDKNEFKYDINERFGSTRPRQSIGGALPYVNMNVSIDIGLPRERQTLTQRLDVGRSRPGSAADDRSLWLLGSTVIPNPMAGILSQSAALSLSRKQSDSLAWFSYQFGIFADSMWTPAARELAALPYGYDRGYAWARYVSARERTVDYLIRVLPQVKALLTPAQRRKLPREISIYLDERVLKFLRSSSAGDISALIR